MMRATVALAAVCLLPLLAGCISPENYQSVTEAAWTNDVKLVRYEPAWRLNLEVYRTPDLKDYLVIYNEEQGKRPVSQRRAYWLAENQKLIAAGLKPNFVMASNLNGLQPIPVQTNQWEQFEMTNIVGPRAVLLHDRLRFVLVSDGKRLGEFSLPVYAKDGGEVFWGARMTVAVATDVVAFPVQTFGPILYLFAQSGYYR